MFEDNEAEGYEDDSILVFPSTEEPPLPEEVIDESTASSVAIDDAKLYKLSQMSDFEGYLKSLLFMHYNTTAVKLDVLQEELATALSDDLLERIKNPLYYAALFIDDSLVNDCVQRSLRVWESQEIIDYIRDCFDKDGTVFKDDTDMLNYAISLLPDNYVRTEDSPAAYKAYRVVLLLKNISVNRSKEEKKSGPVQTVGKTVGKMASIKYDTARAFNEALQEGLGQNADAYFNERTQKRQEREKKAAVENEKEQKEEMEWQRQRQQEKERLGYSHLYSRNSRMSPIENRYMYSSPRRHYADYRYRPGGRDYSPNIPLQYILISINILVFVLLLIADPALAFTTAIGFFVATVGLSRIGKANDKHGRGSGKIPPLPLACLGYLLVVFGLFITM